MSPTVPSGRTGFLRWMRACVPPHATLVARGSNSREPRYWVEYGFVRPWMPPAGNERVLTAPVRVPAQRLRHLHPAVRRKELRRQ